MMSGGPMILHLLTINSSRCHRFCCRRRKYNIVSLLLLCFLILDLRLSNSLLEQQQQRKQQQQKHPSSRQRKVFPKPLHISDKSTSIELQRPTLLISRRQSIQAAYYWSGGFLLTSNADAAATATQEDGGRLNSNNNDRQTPDLNDICSRGALVPENAIPGAYQSTCMNEAQRTIPVKIPYQAAETQLVIQQGAVGAGSTGLAVWNSSLLLKRLLEQLSANDPKWLNRKTVMELGCGTGVVSLTSALLGAKQVIATDGNSAVVNLLSRNIEGNSLTDQVIPAQLQWGLLDAMDYADLADVIVGADLTYNSNTWRSLAETLSTCLKDDGIIIYLSLGHAGFDVNAETSGFFNVATSQGLVEVNPSGDEMWPFPGIQQPLSELLLRNAVSSKERSTVFDGGITAGAGVQVSVLRKKGALRKK